MKDLGRHHANIESGDGSDGRGPGTAEGGHDLRGQAAAKAKQDKLRQRILFALFHPHLLAIRLDVRPAAGRDIFWAEGESRSKSLPLLRRVLWAEQHRGQAV